VAAPAQFTFNILQGKSYDLIDPSVASYLADLLWRNSRRFTSPSRCRTDGVPLSLATSAAWWLHGSGWVQSAVPALGV
jgi:hypothetical protein